MTLLTAHRILIGVSIAFFLLYAVWELAGPGASGAPGNWWRGGAGLVAAGSLGLYARTLFGRRSRRRDDGEEGR